MVPPKRQEHLRWFEGRVSKYKSLLLLPSLYACIILINYIHMSTAYWNGDVSIFLMISPAADAVNDEAQAVLSTPNHTERQEQAKQVLSQKKQQLLEEELALNSSRQDWIKRTQQLLEEELALNSSRQDLMQATKKMEEKEKQLLDWEAALRAREDTGAAATMNDTKLSTIQDTRGNGNKSQSKASLKVMIELRKPRFDRLGSFMERPLWLMGYAHCHGYEFCITPGSESHAKYFGFKTCPKDLKSTFPIRKELSFKHALNQSGLYWTNGNDNDLKIWASQNEDCAFDEVMRSKWGERIIKGSFNDEIENKDLAREELFANTTDPKTITVAVNICRGDFIDWQRKPIPDEFYVLLLRRLRGILQKMGKTPQVHLFSENYGMIRQEKGLSIKPNMRGDGAHIMDMALNLRDWRHFVKADILVVGGTFSRIPALGRPEHPDPKTGLPLTIHPCALDCGNKTSLQHGRSKLTSYQYGWPKKAYGLMPNKINLVNLPPVFANLDDPAEDHVADLLFKWNASLYNTN